MIATAWDATYTLFDGIPSNDDIDRLRANVPFQEAGRVSARELTVSRTNRSVRLFDHVVKRLTAGRQPDEDLIRQVGYLMRTTAVYGSGKLGAADYDSLRTRPELQSPFQAEMLTVFLIRQFTLDLVEHIAEARAPGVAVRLAPELRRKFGVGNSTGLGMAPYLVNHPMLLNSWFGVREKALALVRALPLATAEEANSFRQLIVRARRGVNEWTTDDAVQRQRIAGLAADLERLERHLELKEVSDEFPWDQIYRWADRELGLEAREMLASLLIEGHPDIVDQLESEYQVDESDGFRIDGTRRIADVLALVDTSYEWTAQYDFAVPSEAARFWYTSEEKLEPRLGERWTEEGAALEQPIAIARDIQALREALVRWSRSESLVAFLLAHPEHRHIVRRVLLSEHAPYSEIRDNVISSDMRPIDILRFKLSFFGATRFDPKSDRWLRITMFQHAPCMDEVATADVDGWFLPPVDSRMA